MKGFVMSVAVWGRRNDNGSKELLSHNSKLVKRKVLFIFNIEERQLELKDNTPMQEIAKQAWTSGAYQDVWVIQDNFDPEGWHDYCSSCTWKNGKWCNFPVNTNDCFCFG